MGSLRPVYPTVYRLHLIKKEWMCFSKHIHSFSYHYLIQLQRIAVVTFFVILLT